MKIQSNKDTNLIISISIVLILLLALSPAIFSNNYLRQDDLMWELWPGMKMRDFGFMYYNIFYQMVRPLCMLFYYTTDMISINMHHSVYVRLVSIFTLGACGVLIYFWQLRFNQNKLLAACFSICIFTLPAYQIFTATANYFLINFALLLTISSVFCWHNVYLTNYDHHTKRNTRLGFILFFLSLLQYPLSSMFIWVMLVIALLNPNEASNNSTISGRTFFYRYSLITIFMMLFYFVFIHVFHFVFHVNLSYGRPAVLDTTHIMTRVLGIFNVIEWHSWLWKWDNTTTWLHSPINIIIALFIFTATISSIILKKDSLTTAIKHSIILLGLIFFAFFMSYSPIFATAENVVSFRYTMATMPILLYLIFWSITILSDSSSYTYTLINLFVKSTAISILIATTIFGVIYCNWMIADGIVGPHDHDFAYIQEQLKSKVLPIINKPNTQVVIHAIGCDSGRNYHYAKGLPTALEYGMRLCEFQQQIIGSIFHSMMVMGHLPNYHNHNEVVYNDNEIIVKNTPWGTLIVNDGKDIKHELPQYTENKRELVEIDFTKAPEYKPFDLYKKILNLN